MLTSGRNEVTGEHGGALLDGGSGQLACVVNVVVDGVQLGRLITVVVIGAQLAYTVEGAQLVIVEVTGTHKVIGVEDEGPLGGVYGTELVNTCGVEEDEVREDGTGPGGCDPGGVELDGFGVGGAELGGL